MKAERNEQIRQLFKKGVSVPGIVQRFGLTDARIYQICSGITRNVKALRRRRVGTLNVPHADPNYFPDAPF